MTGPTTLEDFEAIELQVKETGIFLRRFGSGPAVLLLHGFPQTHLMWRAVAPLLARRFTVICADLRGYGRSGCPASRPDHAPYAKRAMANDMVSIMGKLGFPRFSIAGHDRGGRVAYRLALDHPDQVERLAPYVTVNRLASRAIFHCPPSLRSIVSVQPARRTAAPPGGVTMISR
jgi:haloacetate dehalogenase